MALCSSTDDVRSQIDLEPQEVVGVPGFNSIAFQFLLRKILEVEGHDDVGACVDGRCQNVPVRWIWQRDSLDEGLVVRHKAITDVSIHQLTGSLKLFRLQTRASFENIPRPLIMDSLGPFGTV